MPFMDVRIDFSRDYLDSVYQSLKAAGWKGDREDKDIDIVFTNFKRRHVTAKKRDVYISRHLNCPREFRDAYRAIIDKIESGDTVKPHLSRFLKKPDFNDLFLNDWGIHHLHLSLVEEDDGYCERTGPVLLVRFEENYALIIDIRMHGSANLWVQKDILDNIRINWPDWMDRFRVRGAGRQDDLSESERKRLRSVRMNTWVKLSDGNLYVGPGMGLTTAGTSTLATMNADKAMHVIRETEKQIKNDPTYYKRVFWGDLAAWPFRLEVKLSCIGDNYYAVVKHSGTAMSVYAQWPAVSSDAQVCHRRIMSFSASSIASISQL